MVVVVVASTLDIPQGIIRYSMEIIWLVSYACGFGLSLAWSIELGSFAGDNNLWRCRAKEFVFHSGIVLENPTMNSVYVLQC